MTFLDPDSLRAAAGGRWLQRPTSGAVLVGVGLDSRESLHGKAFVAIKGDTHDAHDHLNQAAENGATLLVVERLPKNVVIPDKVGVIQVDNCRKALGKMAQAYRRTLKGTKVIAVTGSAGKTTTKRLIHSMLSTALQGSASPKSFNNDIGVPVTLLAAKNSDKYVIAEVGTNAPGEIAQLSDIVQPDIAVITSLGRSHLAKLGTVEGIAKEKMSMLTYLSPDGLVIVNADAPLLRPHLKLAKTRVLFGEAADADLRLTGYGQSANEHDGMERWWFEMNGRQRFTLRLAGRHNAMNALAAVAVGRRLNLTDEQIAAGLAKAEPAPMRMTRQDIGPITIFNDAYNANPDSMIASLETFAEAASKSKRRVVVMGDMLELGEHGPELHREVGRHLITVDGRARIDHAVFIGPLSCITAVDVAAAWSKDRVTALPGMTDATSQAVKELLRPGDAVLIKASRGMGLERLIGAIEQRFAAKPALATR